MLVEEPREQSKNLFRSFFPTEDISSKCPNAYALETIGQKNNKPNPAAFCMGEWVNAEI